MIWFLVVLVIFWKPIYYIAVYLYFLIKKKENVHRTDEKLMLWLIRLWGLVDPFEEFSNVKKS